MDFTELSFILIVTPQLPEPFSFIFTWFAALPLIFWMAQSITNFIVKDFLILKVGLQQHLFFLKLLDILKQMDDYPEFIFHPGPMSKLWS